MSAEGPQITNGIESTPRYAQQQMLATPEQRKQIRANASLPKEAWIGIEDAVYPAMDDVLTVVADLRDMGLTTNADIMNKIVEWHKQDYTASATVSMDPETDVDDQGNVEYDLDGAPLPMIHSDFSVGFRDSGGSGGDVGPGVETLNAEGSARAVGEAAEDMVLNGWEPTIGGSDGYSLYGLTNHPNAHTGTLGDWTTDASNVRKDLKAMMRDLKNDEFRAGNAGYFTYIGSDLEDPLTEPDPEGTGDLLVRDRLDSLSELGTLKVSDHLASDAVLMFRPTRDVVDLAVGLEEQVVQWESPFRDNFKTIFGFTPRVKDTMRGQCGISYYTGGTA